MNLEGRLIAVGIIITVGMIMKDLIGGMNEEAAVVVIIMMMMTAADHPIVTVEMRDAAIVAAIGGIMIEIMIAEIIAEGEGVVAIVDAAVKGEAEANILDPCREAAVAISLAHVM